MTIKVNEETASRSPTVVVEKDNSLKACPFCGGDARVRFQRLENTVARAWYIECWLCEVGTKFHDSEREATRTWNARVTQDTASPKASNSTTVTDHVVVGSGLTESVTDKASRGTWRAAHEIWVWWFDKGYPVNGEHIDFFETLITKHCMSIPSSESEPSILSKLAEIRERRSKVTAGVAGVHYFENVGFIANAPTDIDTLLSIVDSLQAENKSLQGWKTRTIARCEEVDRLLDASAAEHTRLRSQIEELESAASNMKAEIVKRVREIVRGGFPDDVHVYRDQVLAELEKVATELEAVEVKDDPGR